MVAALERVFAEKAAEKPNEVRGASRMKGASQAPVVEQGCGAVASGCKAAVSGCVVAFDCAVAAIGCIAWGQNGCVENASSEEATASGAVVLGRLPHVEV